MTKSVIEVISSVLTDINVIIASIAVILYLNFVIYVVRYRKKPAKNKKRKIAVQKKAEKSDDSAEDSE